jgi:DNA polymerase III sliding clamp (beta) subunit (PCNA family)
MSIFTDVIDSTGYSDFNESQEVSSGISANLVSRALSTLKVTSSSRAFKGRDTSVALTLKGSRIRFHSSPGLEIFTEFVKGI